MPSILQGGVLNTPGGIPGNTRLALTEDGTVRADGRQHIGNIFARAWDCITRSPEKVEANKELARRFVAELREKYGDAVAGMASRELKAHLTLGRPLTAYRVGCVLEHVVRLKERAADDANVAWLRDQGLSARDIRDVKAQFSLRELSLLRKADLSIDIGRQYQERQIPIHPRTLVTYHCDENVVGEPEQLRGGAVSKPYSVQYRNDARLDSVVFKEACPNEGFGAAAGVLGINPNDSRMAVRNIATKAVDELLGFNLVPDTRIGVLGGKLGMVMDFAEGVPAMKKVPVDITDQPNGQLILSDPDSFKDLIEAGEIQIDGDRVFGFQEAGIQQNYADPGLRRELVKLQLLDALTAQGDRHGGNYLIRRGEDGRFIGLSAIDNDQAFGTRITDPNQLFGGDLRGVKLPPVVDSEMKATFEALTDDQLRGTLAGLLPEAEIEAAVTRLHAIQDYLAGGPPPMVLAGTGPEVWGTDEVGLALSDPTTSYVGRDLSVLARAGMVLSYEEAQ